MCVIEARTYCFADGKRETYETTRYCRNSHDRTLCRDWRREDHGERHVGHSRDSLPPPMSPASGTGRDSLDSASFPPTPPTGASTIEVQPAADLSCRPSTRDRERGVKNYRKVGKPELVLTFGSSKKSGREREKKYHRLSGGSVHSRSSSNQYYFEDDADYATSRLPPIQQASARDIERATYPEISTPPSALSPTSGYYSMRGPAFGTLPSRYSDSHTPFRIEEVTPRSRPSSSHTYPESPSSRRPRRLSTVIHQNPPPRVPSPPPVQPAPPGVMTDGEFLARYMQRPTLEAPPSESSRRSSKRAQEASDQLLAEALAREEAAPVVSKFSSSSSESLFRGSPLNSPSPTIRSTAASSAASDMLRPTAGSSRPSKSSSRQSSKPSSRTPSNYGQPHPYLQPSVVDYIDEYDRQSIGSTSSRRSKIVAKETPEEREAAKAAEEARQAQLELGRVEDRRRQRGEARIAQSEKDRADAREQARLDARIRRQRQEAERKLTGTSQEGEREDARAKQARLLDRLAELDAEKKELDELERRDAKARRRSSSGFWEREKQYYNESLGSPTASPRATKIVTPASVRFEIDNQSERSATTKASNSSRRPKVDVYQDPMSPTSSTSTARRPENMRERGMAVIEEARTQRRAKEAAPSKTKSNRNRKGNVSESSETRTRRGSDERRKRGGPSFF